MLIKNYQQIATTELRKQALTIIEVGINKVHPHALINSAVRYNKNFNSLTIQNKTYNILRGRIFVIGGGKASGFMAERLEKIIGSENITAGIVNCKDDDYKTKKIEIIKAGHPLPDREGVRGVEKMLAIKDRYDMNEKDLVIMLISGGGSALMPCPAGGVNLEDKQKTTQLLLESGADIYEINTIRKHLSKIKGGNLGRHFQPAQVVSIIISDVVGNNLDVIASGPSVADPTTFKDAYTVLLQYNLWEKVPAKARDYIERGCKGREEETPKKLSNCDNYIIGDNAAALEAMAVKAKSLGLRPIIITSELTGDTEIAARGKAQEILSGNYKEYNALLFGGETTPTLPVNYGQGGRNRHFTAAFMLAMKEAKSEWTMAGAGTDGADYLPDAAGAVVDYNSLGLAQEQGLAVEKFINQYDTNTLFKKMGNSLIITGNTGTNVGDVAVCVVSQNNF